MKNDRPSSVRPSSRAPARLARWVVAGLTPLSALGCSLSPEGTASAAPPPVAALTATAAAAAGPSALVARGEHLVLTSGCHDCHTPLKLGPNGPEPDMTRMLSGHPQTAVLPPAPKPVGPWLVATSATNTAWAGPWGTSFTANLTPDRETGLGAWTQEMFMAAIQTGRHEGRGREILPPMPIPAYKNFTPDELQAIFAYLQNIPALSNRVPQPLPPG